MPQAFRGPESHTPSTIPIGKTFAVNEHDNREPLHDRIEDILGNRTHRDVAAATGINHETIRRIRNGQRPTSDFFFALVAEFDANANYILTGAGQPTLTEDERECVRSVPAKELSREIARRLESRDDKIRELKLDVFELKQRLERERPN
jgi:transcriptional regulator with XRE-family HTH domain